MQQESLLNAYLRLLHEPTGTVITSLCFEYDDSSFGRIINEVDHEALRPIQPRGMYVGLVSCFLRGSNMQQESLLNAYLRLLYEPTGAVITSLCFERDDSFTWEDDK